MESVLGCTFVRVWDLGEKVAGVGGYGGLGLGSRQGRQMIMDKDITKDLTFSFCE